MPTSASESIFSGLFPLGRKPFAWQSALLANLVRGEAPESLGLPTATGKTYGIIRCWLAALVENPQGVPRRLAYVVNRRAVIDQVFEDAVALAESVAAPEISTKIAAQVRGADRHDPLKVYAFRGQRNLDHGWLTYPEHPAILIGTVDMLGSRLLFRAYAGSGNWRRAQSAGLLGQDTWFVLDEPHLAHPFRNLLAKIASLQKASKTIRPFWFTQIGATNRGAAGNAILQQSVRKDEALAGRLNACKRVLVASKPVDDEGFVKHSTEIVKNALGEGKTLSVGIIVSTVRLARALRQAFSLISKSLAQTPAIYTITGAMRGVDRDELLASPDFRNAFAAAGRTRNASAILIGTHCLEAGFDGDFDLLVSDIPSLPSVLQRLGRLNRVGNCGETTAHLFLVTSKQVPAAADPAKESHTWLTATGKTSGGSCCELSGSYESATAPSLLAAWDALDEAGKESLSEPTVAHPPFERVDALLFSASSFLPGASKMRTELYLHGYEEAERAQTSFVWRDEARWLSGDALGQGLQLRRPLPAEMADLSPGAAREELIGMLRRLLKHRRFDLIDKLAVFDPWSGECSPAFATKAGGKHQVPDSRNLANKIIVLPPEAGGYADGFVEGSAAEIVPEVAETVRRETLPLAGYCWSGSGLVLSNGALVCVPPPEDLALREALPSGRRVLSDSLPLFAATGWLLLRPAAKGGKTSTAATGLAEHLEQVAAAASQICLAVSVPADLAKDVTSAARSHDAGKAHHGFQRYLGNFDPAKPVAKSSRPVGGKSPFRHEALSVLRTGACGQLDSQLVGAHHGLGRPLFDPGMRVPHAKTGELTAPDGHWLRSFSRFSSIFSPWTLAWLESLLRAADAKASADAIAVEEETL